MGKTWLARDLAARAGLRLVECNFERDPGLATCFESNNPTQILGEIALRLGTPAAVEGTLLLLDEIQAGGDVLARLRWFAEELPELPVLATGSLLEFTLADHAFSMPVGRVSFLHIEPMDFPEFLRAHGRDDVLRRLRSWTPGEPVSDALHRVSLALVDRYAMVGGLPAVVGADAEGHDAHDVRRRQHELVEGYRSDFSKYAARTDPLVLDAVLRGVAYQLGENFVYTRAAEGVPHYRVSRAFELLTLARVCHRVTLTTADRPPLGGAVRTRTRKAVMADIGLAQALLGTAASTVFPAFTDLLPHTRGALAEQLVSQSLRALAARSHEPRLYYWQRGGGRPGEVDFVVESGGDVVPVEVKSGRDGRHRALHHYMHDKQLRVAVVCNRSVPGTRDVDVGIGTGGRVRYRLVSLPPYLMFRLHDAVGDTR